MVRTADRVVRENDSGTGSLQGLQYVDDILQSPNLRRTMRFWRRGHTLVVDYVDDVVGIGLRVRWWDGGFVGFL